MIIESSLRLPTERCVLRFISEADIPYIFSASQVEGFTDGMLWNPPANQEEMIEPHKKSVAAWENGTAYSFTIESADNAEFIGRITIREGSQADEWDLGFFTHPVHQGKGYMSEAIARILLFGFSVLGAKEITASYATWNKASEAVLTKNGFKSRILVTSAPLGFKRLLPFQYKPLRVF